MELQLTTFKQAKALKELGYPQSIISASKVFGIRTQKQTSNLNYLAIYGDDGQYIPAPTLELAAKWLREEKNILIEITRVFGKYAGRIMELHTSGERNPHIQFQDYSSYEEALSVGIDKAIEMLKKGE